MKLTFIGAGYVGLTSAAVLSELGNQVWVVDVDAAKIAGLKKGQVAFFEPELAALVAQNVNNGSLAPTTDYGAAIPNSEIIFIAVGTPAAADGTADLAQVFAAARTLATFLTDKYTLVVNKSTVPPGTVRRIEAIIKETNPQANFEVASSPEFLREGHAVEDTRKPDRVVIGVDSDRAFNWLEELHRPLGAPVVRTSVASAEIIKYAANSYLGLRIGFIDQVANLCEATGADVRDIIEGVGLDKRIGGHYWYPGIGYGGYCYPKDIRAFGECFKAYGEPDNLFSKLDEYNRARPARLVSKIGEILGGLAGQRIGVLGLTAKPGNDDMRGSPAVHFIKALQAAGAAVSAFDPMGMPNARELLDGVTFAGDPYAAVRGADAVAILCEWEDFRSLDWARIGRETRGDLIFDAKRMFSPEELQNHGLRYLGVGRAFQG